MHLIFTGIMIMFSCVMHVNTLYAMKSLPGKFGQNEDMHYDIKNNLHYGYIHGFEQGVNHTGFEPCSVQEGLKTGRNVYVDDENATLVITKQCTHWIDIDGDNVEYNDKQLQALITTI